MLEFTATEYLSFLAQRITVLVGGSEIHLLGHQRPHILQPEYFKTETDTLWSFRNRSRWATHKLSFRGNLAPQIPRNLILRYTQPRGIVLDQMAGDGTTLIECKLTGRQAIGVDINRDCLMVARDSFNFSGTLLENPS